MWVAWSGACLLSVALCPRPLEGGVYLEIEKKKHEERRESQQEGEEVGT